MLIENEIETEKRDLIESKNEKIEIKENEKNIELEIIEKQTEKNIENNFDDKLSKFILNWDQLDHFTPLQVIFLYFNLYFFFLI